MPPLPPLPPDEPPEVPVDVLVGAEWLVLLWACAELPRVGWVSCAAADCWGLAEPPPWVLLAWCVVAAWWAFPLLALV